MFIIFFYNSKLYIIKTPGDGFKIKGTRYMKAKLKGELNERPEMPVFIDLLLNNQRINPDPITEGMPET